jgi:P2X purinoceptor 4
VYRILVKAYGLRFIINVTGNAGKFNIVPLLISVGSGIGLLSVATIVVDCFLLNLAKKRNLYKEVKRLEYKKELGKEIQLN